MNQLIGQLLFWLGVIATFRFGMPLLAGIAWLPYWVAFLICYIVAAIVGVSLVTCFLNLSPDACYLTKEKIYGMGYIWGPIDCLGPYVMMGIGLLVMAVGRFIYDVAIRPYPGVQIALGVLFWIPIIYVIIHAIREERRRTAWKRKPERALIRILKAAAFIFGLLVAAIVVVLIGIAVTYG